MHIALKIRSCCQEQNDCITILQDFYAIEGIKIFDNDDQVNKLTI